MTGVVGVADDVGSGRRGTAAWPGHEKLFTTRINQYCNNFISSAFCLKIGTCILTDSRIRWSTQALCVELLCVL